MKSENSRYGHRSLCHIHWAILTHTLAWAFTVTLQASSPSWAVLGIQHTGLNSDVAAISANGEIYSSAFEATPQGPCPAATATVGDASQFSSCVTKTDASGVVAFSIRIGGADVKALVLDAQGSPYIAGSTGSVGAPGFATTPGAYQSRPPNELDSFVCKLSSADGHPLSCTFVDVGLLDNPTASINPGFNVDTAGNTYLAGYCADFQHLCAEKLNSTGTATAYLTSLTQFLSPISRKSHS